MCWRWEIHLLQGFLFSKSRWNMGWNHLKLYEYMDLIWFDTTLKSGFLQPTLRFIYHKIGIFLTEWWASSILSVGMFFRLLGTWISPNIGQWGLPKNGSWGWGGPIKKPVLVSGFWGNYGSDKTICATAIQFWTIRCEPSHMRPLVVECRLTTPKVKI